MNNKVKIKGTKEIDVYHQEGIVTKESITDQLDTCIVIYDSVCIGNFTQELIKNYDKVTRYEKYDQVQLCIDYNEESESAYFNRYYLVMNDDITELKECSQYQCIYSHTLILIEPTKYLENIFINNCAFTNKDDSLIEQIEKMFYKCELKEAGYKPRFKLSQRLKQRLRGIEGEDFFFNGLVNLRQALDEMLSICDLRVRIHKIDDFNNNIEIDFDDLNKLKNEVNNIDFINFELTNDAEYNVGTLVSQVSNAIGNPIQTGWLTTKTEDAIFDSENGTVLLPFPIERILKAELRHNFIYQVVYNEGSSNITENTKTEIFDKPINFTKYLKDYREFILLDEKVNIVSITNYSKFGKDNCLYYKQGEKIIENISGRGKNWIGITYSILENMIDHVCYNLIFNMPFYKDVKIKKILKISYDLNSIIFRFNYIPYLNLQLETTKNLLKIKEKTLDNQNVTNTLLTKYGRNLQGKIQRIGNDELYLDVVHSYIGNLYELGNYTIFNNSLYIFISREFQTFNDFIKCRYKLTKNFNNLNEKITIKREKRVYKIPLESYLARTINLNFKILFNDKKIEVSEDMKELTYTLVTTFSAFGGASPNGIFIKNDYTESLLETAKCYIGNSFTIVGKCINNIYVDYRVKGRTLGGKEMEGVKYANDNGEFINTEIILNWLVQNKNTGDVVFNKIFELPEVRIDEQFNLYKKNFIIYKDAYEELQFQANFESISLNKDIIIGEKFSEINSLMMESKIDYIYPKINMYLYYSDKEEYSFFDKKGKMKVGDNPILIPFENTDGNADEIISRNSKSITLEKSLPIDTMSWALCDKFGNLIIGINNPLIKTIYLGVVL